MKVLFNKAAFSLCYVPVPQGYPQSQTHCGIVLANERYYMITSPYPNPNRPLWLRYFAAAIWKLTFHMVNILYKGEDFENPMLYESVSFPGNDIPVRFELVKGSPLMKKPFDENGKGSFCSDPDISFIDGYIYILNRTTVRGDIKNGKSGKTIVHLIKGLVDKGSFVFLSNQPLFVEDYKSPCMIKFRNKYYYFCLDTNSYNDGEKCRNLLVRTSDDLINWGALTSLQMDNGDYEPWHMSVFEYDNKLYSIIACVKRGMSHRCWQMLGEFDENLTKIKIYQTPLSDYKSYRGAGVVREDGEFILYNTTVQEKIAGGIAVDGREVVMAHTPFEIMMNKLNRLA